MADLGLMDPAIAGRLLGGQGVPVMWMSARALGVAAWLAASAVVIVGVSLRSRALNGVFTPRTVTILHRALAGTTVLLVLAHVALLVPDPYAKLRWWDAVLPGFAVSQRWATATATVALLLLVAVAVAALLRSRISARVWRAVHIAAYAVWPLATFHYLAMGTDAMRAWSLAMTAVVSLAVVGAVVRRGMFAPKAPVRAARPARERAPAKASTANPVRPPAGDVSRGGTDARPAPGVTPAGAPATSGG